MGNDGNQADKNDGQAAGVQQDAGNAAQAGEGGAGAAQQQAAGTQADGAQAQPAPAGSTVNAHKYQRDIAKLEAERDAAKAEAEGYKALKAEFEEWKAEQEAAKAEAALKEAGCHDVVAASARLKEFDGDVAKLKEAAPYLFSSADKSKSTGGSQKGAPDPEDERTKKMRAIFGLDND